MKINVMPSQTKIRAVVFDLDNTLIDFVRMKKLSCEAAIKAMRRSGLRISQRRGMKILFQLYDKRGWEYQEIFQLFLKHVTGRVDYAIMASGIIAYRHVKEDLTAPYKNVIPTLSKIRKKGIRLGILTDAPKLQAYTRLVEMGMHKKFDVILTYDDTKRKKPNPKPFIMIAKKMNLKPEQILFVGDSLSRDVKGAKKVGMRTVLAKYGQQKMKKSGINPDYTINDIGELARVI